MNRNLKIIEPNTGRVPYLSPYQEIATYVRELLHCDYALVAVPEEDAIRICAIASAEPETAPNIADVISRLRDWGPMVVDDSRLIVVPIMCGDHLMGVLVGYSSNPGTFRSEDLEKLMNYSHVALAMLANTWEERGVTRTSFSPDQLLRFSRLITIGELTACFAHEVANPLMLIRGQVRLVKEKLPADGPVRNSFDVIEQSSLRIEEMARRMLDFSRQRTRQTEPCDIAELISDSLRFVQPYVKDNDVDVRRHLEPQLPVIDLDRAQMVQALVNLLQNAVDSMAEVEKRILSITARVEGGVMRIAISDTGAGIESSNVSQIFQPFFTTKGERGTGLGLFITKQVIEDHHGSIDVETGSRGTTFVISLPL